jgi:ubiquitin-protein ligase
MPIVGSLFIWNGVIFASDGPFRSGVFRFSIFLDDYPACPTIKITSKITHPLIDKLTGRLDMPGFAWNLDRTIANVLAYLSDCINCKNVALYAEYCQSKLVDFDYDLFLNLAKESAQKSHIAVYQDADSVIKFSPWNLNVHPEKLGSILSPQ